MIFSPPFGKEDRLVSLGGRRFAVGNYVFVYICRFIWGCTQQNTGLSLDPSIAI